MVANSLRASFRDLSVSNVFVYVGDAVRADAIPAEFANQGASVRTVASSTHSPASFASLATGCYPPTHGVRSFNDRLPESLTRLFDLPGVDTRFLNSIFAYATEYHGSDVDPIHSVLNTEPDAVSSPFEGLEPPFVTMERGPGGHAPYGDHTGTAVEYFEDRGGDRQTIQADYERSIELDIEVFESRIKELAERGILEETLVIYTSDHGELLGEGGALGHNDPMRPELVYVPTIFRHPDVPQETLGDTSFHHTDLFPTILTALGRDADWDQFDGKSLVEALSDTPRPCFWENQFLPDKIPGISGRLGYEGVWDSGGGWVRTDSSRLDRYSVLLGKLFRSSKRRYMRRHIGECFRSHWWGQQTFGNPGFDDDQAQSVLERAKSDARRGERRDLSEAETERLRDQDT
ncbi:sulfatase-like hydrolase/transferase [Halomicroarcula sp. GCM10025894]|uniref:sulfatase-like hydrolase/transferase n=1 Tax=Halomicroarcula sp. GCM10025894 TaxID=3252673 RepID=UPI00361CA701